MNLSQYFDAKKGTGILATANNKGQVNSAIYSRPHFLDDEQPGHVAFVMRDRLSHKFLESNPHAFYTFIENSEGYQGKRLVLQKVKEETERDKIMSIRRRDTPPVCRENEQNEEMFLVHFKVVDERPLVGEARR